MPVSVDLLSSTGCMEQTRDSGLTWLAGNVRSSCSKMNDPLDCYSFGHFNLFVHWMMVAVLMPVNKLHHQKQYSNILLKKFSHLFINYVTNVDTISCIVSLQIHICFVAVYKSAQGFKISSSDVFVVGRGQPKFGLEMKDQRSCICLSDPAPHRKSHPYRN